MGAVAGALAQMGHSVQGADANLYPPMSDFLREQGIVCHEGFATDRLVRARADVIVAGNAVGRGNPLIEYALAQRLTMRSMPEVVRDYLIAQSRALVVSGTHGKTTTTSMLAWLLEAAGLQPGFLIGGIPGNFQVGCRPPQPEGVMVLEGDEYDSAFFDKRGKYIHYRPDIAIVNNIEFDHADIFLSLADVKRSFRHFLRLIPGNGLLLAAADDANVQDIIDEAHTRVESFGRAAAADWRIVEEEHGPDGSSFGLLRAGAAIGRFQIPMTGAHNVNNAAAGIAVARQLGVAPAVIREGLAGFRPPKRRMEVLGEWRGMTVIDDFAHHPTAISATLQALRRQYPDRRLLACFEPRSNTTTRNVFQHTLAASFSEAAVVALGALNRPERYNPAERLDTKRLQQELAAQGKKVKLISAEEGLAEDWGRHVLQFLTSEGRTGDIIVLLSNGNFGQIRRLMFDTDVKAVGNLTGGK